MESSEHLFFFGIDDMPKMGRLSTETLGGSAIVDGHRSGQNATRPIYFCFAQNGASRSALLLRG